MTTQTNFLLTIQPPAGDQQVFEIPTGVAIIGRQPGTALRLDQTKISRQHAKIECDGLECLLTDLQSANGTRLDGKNLQPLLPYRLRAGALIEIGDFTLTYTEERVEVFEQPPSIAEMPEIAAPPPAESDESLRAEPPVVEGQPPADSGAGSEAPPPPETPPPPAAGTGPVMPPGMDDKSRFLIRFLPEIYHTDFMERFLGIFESILLPVEWNIDNFDLYLSPATAPETFLPWLAAWYNFPFDTTWTPERRRELLAEAAQLYAMRGTKKALCRVLEIYTGAQPIIDDASKDLPPYSFTVRLPGKQRQYNRQNIQRLIEANKPAHATFTLLIEE